MEKYILSVCGAVILSALVTILLPEGKIGKFINGILKLFCLLIMLLPLYGLFETFLHTGGGGGFEGEQAQLAPDEEYLDYVYGKQAKMQETQLSEYFAEKYGVETEIAIAWQCAEFSYDVTKIEIKIKNFGMNDESTHIYIIDQIEDHASEIYQNAEVLVYE